MNKIIIPTGYMGSGSSAVTNLLSEIEGYDINNEEFEYIMLHCPDGLFDLQDKLLFGNNALRSDEALYRFIECMKDLYDKKNYWVSGYRNKISTEFLHNCELFVNSLVDSNLKDTYWYFQQNPVGLKMKMINYLRRGVGKISTGKVKINRPVKYKTMRLSFPTSEKFYVAAKEFLGKFYKDMGYDSHNLVLDQFLLPHNLFRINNYFDDNVRIIVVDRDPRDVFVLNKYVWKPQSVAVPYPLEAEEFCGVYKKIREAERNINDEKIMRIHFEDIIYKYEESIANILTFIGTSKEEHLKKRQIFNPAISISNTQLFTMNNKSIIECKIISEKLHDYIYPFPEKQIYNKKSVSVF